MVEVKDVDLSRPDFIDHDQGQPAEPQFASAQIVYDGSSKGMQSEQNFDVHCFC